jgi:antitoxin (DNA-binding transcriptional repressor) of toxin-antitoxin stability system
MKHGFGRLTMAFDQVKLELNMKTTAVPTINTKQLRAELGRIVVKARRGASFLVLHRSRPAFQIVPADVGGTSLPPLQKDPLYRAEALGKSKDGFAATDHDRVLYGK